MEVESTTYKRVLINEFSSFENKQVTVVGKPISFQNSQLVLETSESDPQKLFIEGFEQDIDISQLPFVEVQGTVTGDNRIRLHNMIQLEENLDLESYNQFLTLSRSDKFRYLYE